MSAQWSAQELQTLENLLVDGLAISTIQNQINRTEGAISKKAHARGYSTKDNSGVKTLHKGIIRRYTGSSEKQKITTEKITNSLSINSDALEVNNQVVDMLSKYNVFITPEIVYTLSKHILDSRGAYNVE
jgi:hypothetical protein